MPFRFFRIYLSFSGMTLHFLFQCFGTVPSCRLHYKSFLSYGPDWLVCWFGIYGISTFVGYLMLALVNNKADHKQNAKLNQLLYKDSIQMVDKILLHRPQSTTSHSSHLDWISPFEVVKTNDMVIQVKNEKG